MQLDIDFLLVGRVRIVATIEVDHCGVVVEVIDGDGGNSLNLMELFIQLLLALAAWMRVHVLHIQDIDVHGSVEDLKFLGRLIIERKPTKRDEDDQQPHEEDIEGNV